MGEWSTFILTGNTNGSTGINIYSSIPSFRGMVMVLPEGKRIDAPALSRYPSDDGGNENISWSESVVKCKSDR